MKEIVEFRISSKYYHLLPKPNNAVFNGADYVIKVFKDSLLYNKIGELKELVEKKYKGFFYIYSAITRTYTSKEFAQARLLSVNIKSFFEPAGEDCGTQYDESEECKLCGCTRKQIGPLRLKRGSIPKKDIADTIGGEIVISKRFAEAVAHYKLEGICLNPVYFGTKESDYYQLTALTEVELSPKTIAGVNVFDMAEVGDGFTYKLQDDSIYSTGKEYFKCPAGHTIGLNLLSEGYVMDSPDIYKYDFIASRQRVGVKRGVLYPEPLYFCSPAFKKMVEKEGLKGFKFEVAHIEE